MNNSKNNNSNIIEGTTKVPSVVLRKCCACGKIIDRNELIRILKEHKTGNIIINPTNKQFGRSTYLCKNPECLKIAIKKKRLKNFSDDLINELKNFF